METAVIPHEWDDAKTVAEDIYMKQDRYCADVLIDLVVRIVSPAHRTSAPGIVNFKYLIE